MKKWTKKNKKADFDKMSNVLGINKNIAKILVNRDINTKRKASLFLEPSLDKFGDFSNIKDIDVAIVELKKSVFNNEKILIYGDYDVDGVSSTTILYKALKELTHNVEYYIPHREDEGYGLNIDTLKVLIKKDIDLIITCDNGITSIDEVAFLKENNIKVIIIDHHEPIIDENGDMLLPNANAVIDPRRLDCEYNFKLMCAGGLSYRFIKYFFNEIQTNLLCEDELLVFAMIATICDIVDLYEDNRIIVKNGLDILNRNKSINQGLYKLLEKNNILNNIINDYEVGFVIGPCINAVGRLEKATTAVDLFTNDNEHTTDELSELLVSLNAQRKLLTKESYDRVLEKILGEQLNKYDIIVVYDENTHESIAGIVAGRIKDYFYKPTIVLTKSIDVAKGSARSIPSCDIYKLLSKSRDLFIKFGGHSMAAGMSLDKSKIDILREELNKNAELTADDFIEVIKIEEQLFIEDMTLDFVNSLEKLKPYGKGNREPLFGTKNVTISSIKVFESKNTMILFLSDDSTFNKVKCVSFGFIEKFKEILSEVYNDEQISNILNANLKEIKLNVDIVYSLQINEYNNNISVQTILKDMRISK